MSRTGIADYGDIRCHRAVPPIYSLFISKGKRKKKIAGRIRTQGLGWLSSMLFHRPFFLSSRPTSIGTQ